MTSPAKAPESLPGVYLLLIRIAPGRGFEAEIGNHRQAFPPGWYAYIGRDMRAAAPRVARHLRTSQFRKWHVDHLLAGGRVIDIQLRITADPLDECRTAADVGTWPGALPIPNFGAGDCACATHLYRFHRRPVDSILASRFTPNRIRELFARLDTRWEDHARHPHEPFRTLITCILSLRTKDPVTAAASDRLFAVLRTPREFAEADPEAIASLIFPVGMYRRKSRRLIEIARRILADFNGEVPADIEALTTLPGVGRKTANLVLSFAFHKPAICVDTHVHRITNRWGLVRTATPEETETALRRRLPEALWSRTNPYLVQHGQQICRPTAPNCPACPLADLCRFHELRLERRVLDSVPGAPPHPSLKHFRLASDPRIPPKTAGRRREPGPFDP